MSFTPWKRDVAAAEADGLEPVGWATLSARLSATHRLRRQLGTTASAHPRCGTASFAPHVRNPVPALDPLVSAQSNDPVNLEPLGDGKARDDMGCGTGGDQSSRDCRTRGMQ